jgi:hypothetical protein
VVWLGPVGQVPVELSREFVSWAGHPGVGWSGERNGAACGDVRGELVQGRWGQAYPEGPERVAQQVLNLGCRSTLVASRQRVQHGTGVAAALIADLAGDPGP